ncbi:helix-hairpin-helix domain-containing protein [Endozoicomonas sp. 8E]|uniref:helix-hairpin-helix domain-containing protein n=1 Tax=Endozoicomonas sp. 8E TaxID=3035692 RepID=UPI002938FB98|nr:helix-hairpin-helix domain-containing protein [Endozoicomonas sp. 8E]WOG26797.1 helix-hairpin-helix domain-containing protein [Endozoicomonas sp. 8E]
MKHLFSLFLLLIPMAVWSACPSWTSEQAQKQIVALQKEIRHNDDLYYNKHSPVLTDHEYDGLKAQLQSLIQCFPELTLPPVAEENTEGDVDHRAFMGSLKKARDIDDIKKFLKQAGKEIILVQPKIDGVAVELVYQNGKLVAASTRGTGDRGQNILDAVKHMPMIPKALITEYNDIVLHGELFARLNETVKNSVYSSARHYVSGHISRNQLDVSSLGSIEFFPWRWVNSPFDSDKTVINTLYGYGFELPAQHTQRGNTLKEIEKIRHTYNKRSGIEPFLMDGIVLKLDNLELRKKLGWESQNPAWAIAWKFPSDSAITTVKDVDFRVGRTGQITPVLQLEPIAIGGETVRQVSLGSTKNLTEKDIAIGDQISVQLKGAATPVFGQVVLRPEHRTRPKLPDPKKYDAFSCLELKPGCEEQFTERLKWLGISLDIPFLHEPLIKKLMANKAIDRFPDSFKVSESDLKEAGLNEHSSKQLLSVLNTLHRVSLRSQIRALSIPQLGETRSGKLASHFKSWDKILDATPEEMAAVALISVEQARRAKDYLNTSDIRDSIECFRRP